MQVDEISAMRDKTATRLEWVNAGYRVVTDNTLGSFW